SRAARPSETLEFWIKDRQELFARFRYRAFLLFRDFSCATRRKFSPSDRSQRATSFYARRSNRALLARRNNVHRADQAPYALHRQTSSQPRRAPYAFRQLRECL